MKYRRKQTTVEAFAFHGPLTIEEMRIEWGQPFIHEIVAFTADELVLWCEPEDEIVEVKHGDWIVKEDENFRVLKPHVFRATYEPL